MVYGILMFLMLYGEALGTSSTVYHFPASPHLSMEVVYEVHFWELVPRQTGIKNCIVDWLPERTEAPSFISAGCEKVFGN